jgi:hypothetical protein
MNAAFELPEGELSWRTKLKFEIGSLKAIDVAKKSLEKRPLEAAGG